MPLISVLIPIYNVDIRQLATQLLVACDRAGVPYQIICLDDGSNQDIVVLNQEVSSLMHVNYTCMLENIGRARIRNRAAKLARYEYLLFIDCDSIAVPQDYIAAYIEAIKSYDVVYGGRKYDKEIHSQHPDTAIHYYYGVKREALPANIRSKNPVISSLSNNFIVKADLFEKVKFDETVEGYGYEDLAFFYKLAQYTDRFGHIDNELVHGILDTNTAFLSKTKNAINNLAILHHRGVIPKTKLIKTYNSVVYLMNILSQSQKEQFIDFMTDRLLKYPSTIYYLDLLKLLWYDAVISKEK